MLHPPIRAALLSAFIVLLLASCGADDTAPAAPSGTPAPQTQAAKPAQTQPEADVPPGFDMSVLPVSTVSIGSFPYLSLPEGYRTSEDSTVERDRAPFWTGKDFEWVEGRVHQAAIFAEPGTTFSDFELRSYVDAMLDRIGAVLVAEQDGIPMHQAAEAGLDEAVRMKYRAGLGHFYTSPVRTYVVRRADGNVWVHFSTHERGANWIIARSAHYDPTIRLLSGVELKRLIDADGRAIIHVNFGSGDAVVQSDSLPQLEQLVLLLNRNPDLSLSINGHTDSQGDAARNLALSTARAEAVTDALRQHGIEASRLVAEGFGEAEPLADNATAEGRARNRRVELVRR